MQQHVVSRGWLVERTDPFPQPLAQLRDFMASVIALVSSVDMVVQCPMEQAMLSLKSSATRKVERGTTSPEKTTSCMQDTM